MVPRVSVVVVSFNTRDLLRSCLRSVVDSPFHTVIGHADDKHGRTALAQSPNPAHHSFPMTHHSAQPGAPLPGHHTSLPIELIVVDNASADGSAEMVRAEYPHVLLIPAGENLGFARATNLGLKHARGDLLLLLNPDTEVVSDAVARLAAFMDEHQDVGCVGPSLVYGAGSYQHAAFHFPTLWMSFFDFFPLHHRLLNSSLNGRYPRTSDTKPFPVDHPLGAAMMVRGEALQVVGLLDEAFFMYCEEVDWCIRARRAGLAIYQVPAARVIHHSGQSTTQFRDAMFVELHRSRYRLFAKHYSPAFVRAHRAITRLGLAKEAMLARWMATRGRIDRAELAARLKAYETIRDM